MNRTFRVYTSPDVQGIEIGAALKNVIALRPACPTDSATGQREGGPDYQRDQGDFRSADAMGGRQETLSGLAGTGDLIVTCSSRHSRNRGQGCCRARHGAPRRPWRR